MNFKHFSLTNPPTPFSATFKAVEMFLNNAFSNALLGFFAYPGLRVTPVISIHSNNLLISTKCFLPGSTTCCYTLDLSIDPKDKTLNLSYVYVSPDFTGKHIFSKSFSYLLDRLKQLSMVEYVTTSASHVATLSLFAPQWKTTPVYDYYRKELVSVVSQADESLQDPYRLVLYNPLNGEMNGGVFLKVSLSNLVL